MDTSVTAKTDGLPGDEPSLVRQARTDAEAFAELYRRHVSGVYRYHAAHTGDFRDAEDLTSQTFMAALEGLRSYRGEGSFAAWLMGIASRKRALFFRGRRASLPLDAASGTPDPKPPPEQVADQNLRLDAVARALKHISPERAEAIILCAFGGLTYREAGRTLRKSEAAVKMLVSRGLQDLRQRTSLALEVER
ncbi:MAG: RNA polymerase sigma factor [Bacteroidota bacterium]